MSENPYLPPVSNVGQQLKKKSVIERFILNFLKHWNGNAKLASAFFCYFLIGNVASLILFGLVIRVTRFVVGNLIANHLSSILIWLCIIYLVASVKIIWSCAKNSAHTGFYYITRGLIIVLIGIIAFSLFQVVYVSIRNAY